MRLAIIPARGGSKRIPGKNVKEFCGKPILSYSIAAAIDSGLFDEVMVSTGSPEIAELAVKYGASVPFMRSEAASSDYASTDDVIREVLKEYEIRGRHFDVMCCIYPTAPFVTAEKLRDSMKAFEKENQLALLPVVRYSYPPQRAFVIKDGLLTYQFPEFINSRSQDLEPIYHDCGQYCIYRIDENNGFCADRFSPYIVSELEVQDIDNEADWRIAEMKYRTMLEMAKKGELYGDTRNT